MPSVKNKEGEIGISDLNRKIEQVETKLKQQNDGKLPLIAPTMEQQLREFFTGQTISDGQLPSNQLAIMPASN
jgi:hypothetical protein